jgi:hypothetical protein
VLRHQFGQNFVLGPDLLLQVLDPFLFRPRFGPGFLLKGHGAILEELLLPAIEYRRLQPQFIAQLRDRLLIQQMPPQDGDLLF